MQPTARTDALYPYVHTGSVLIPNGLVDARGEPADILSHIHISWIDAMLDLGGIYVPTALGAVFVAG
jgi:hypothetical protein